MTPKRKIKPVKMWAVVNTDTGMILRRASQERTDSKSICEWFKSAVGKNYRVIPVKVSAWPTKRKKVKRC